SIKGVKGVTGKEAVTTYDLLICLRHSRSKRPDKALESANAPSKNFVEKVVRGCISASPRGCRTDEVYSAVIRAALDAHLSLSGITMPSVASVCRSIGA